MVRRCSSPQLFAVLHPHFQPFHAPLQEACDLMVQCMSLDPELRPSATEVMQRLAALQNHVQERQP